MLRFIRGRAARGPASPLPGHPVFHACGQRSRLALLAAAALVTASAATPCLASLGRAPSSFAGTNSVHQARALAAASGTSATTAGNGSASYSVSTTTLTGGTTVREYVGADGVVFAVTWNGPFLPDLRELLGQHFTTLTNESARQPKAGRGQVRVAQPDVTIESGGHMRAYAGRAWINSRLPAGFDTDTLE